MSPASWLNNAFLSLVNPWFQAKPIQANKYSAPRPIVTNKNTKRPTTNSVVVQALSEPNCAIPIDTISVQAAVTAPYPPGALPTWELVFPALFDPDVINTPLYQLRSDARLVVSGQLYLLVSILFPSFVSNIHWDDFVMQNQSADIVEILGAIALASTPPMRFTTTILPEIRIVT